MKPRSFLYNLRQGFKNIWRNRMFSAASIATMAACILVFGIFFSILLNVNHMIRTLEEEVGITVLFDEGLDDKSMEDIGKKIEKMEHVTNVKFTSAEEAWESFQEEYFEGNPEFAESFADDNPLANSASYTVQVDEIENQNGVVKQIEKLKGVRQVNQSAAATKTLVSFNRLFMYVSIGIIAILLVVSVILISNTVNVGITVRRSEIAIMKLIGATDAFVRAPFIVEGLLLGLIGAAIPLVFLYFAYGKMIEAVLKRFEILSSLASSLPTVNEIFVSLVPAALGLGLGIGLIGSIITVRRHLDI
ncbi:MAG: permease-like cell division protein FtsX [Lachnospiraceae bacterium]|nr:permease-like cell division protein FtsX [Lachnospiraceae bacterium]